MREVSDVAQALGERGWKQQSQWPSGHKGARTLEPSLVEIGTATWFTPSPAHHAVRRCKPTSRGGGMLSGGQPRRQNVPAEHYALFNPLVIHAFQSGKKFQKLDEVMLYDDKGQIQPEILNLWYSEN